MVVPCSAAMLNCGHEFEWFTPNLHPQVPTALLGTPQWDHLRWSRGGNWRWVSCLLGDCLSHWTVGWEARYHSSVSDVFSIPSWSSKRRLGVYGVGSLAGAVSQAEELTSEPKLHLSGHFSSIKTLKECAWYQQSTQGPRVPCSTVTNVHVRASHTHSAVLATELLCCWECFC